MNLTITLTTNRLNCSFVFRKEKLHSIILKITIRGMITEIHNYSKRMKETTRISNIKPTVTVYIA